MNKKKILITGGVGFVGINLIKKLIPSKKYDIYATYFMRKPYLFKNKVKYIHADLTNENDCMHVCKSASIGLILV